MDQSNSEDYLIEVWDNRGLVLRFHGIPEDILKCEDYRTVTWFQNLSTSKKWFKFCEMYDTIKHTSGTFSHEGYIIRISDRR